MSRETEFRGKRVDNGGWAYGWYFEDAAGISFIIEPKLRAYLHNDDPEIDDWVVDYFVEVIPETVGQSTGRKDKNDKKIYAGDEVKTKDRCVFIVVFENGAFRLQDIPTELWHCICDSYAVIELELEIIGNIHEKPELKEVEK